MRNTLCLLGFRYPSAMTSTIGKLAVAVGAIAGVAGIGSISRPADETDWTDQAAASAEQWLAEAEPEQLADELSAGVAEIAVATEIARAREPQPGDSWGGCNDARAAGTAPIYRGEPGYRMDMDGDNDGIACEPRPGV